MDEDSISAMCAAHGPVASACRFAAGAIFGDWRLTAFIGRGGNGEVYCAEHVALGTSAALKIGLPAYLLMTSDIFRILILIL